MFVNQRSYTIYHFFLYICVCVPNCLHNYVFCSVLFPPARSTVCLDLDPYTGKQIRTGNQVPNTFGQQPKMCQRHVRLIHLADPRAGT